MRHALRIIDAINQWVGKLFPYIFYPALLALLWELVARHAFGAPTVWAHGMAQRIFAIFYIVGGGHTLLLKQHIRMDLVFDRLSPRRQAIVDVASSCFLFLFAGILLWQGAGFFWSSWIIREVDSTPFHAILYPVKLAVPLAAFLLLIQGLAKLTRDLTFAITGREYES